MRSGREAAPYVIGFSSKLLGKAEPWLLDLPR